MTASDPQVCDPATMGLRGLCLIEASAGTGKTYTITALALRMIVEQDIAVDALLIVTFTKAATAELKGRIYERLLAARAMLDHQASSDPLLTKLEERWATSPGHDKARRRILAAIADFDRASVFTIHGWCQRLLQDHSFARGDVSALDMQADHSDWLDSFAQDFWSRRLYDLPSALVSAIYQSASTCGPDALIKVAGLALADPDVRVAGAPSWEGAAKRFQDLEQGWREHKTRVAHAWSADPQEIRDYFQTIRPKLNQNTHRATTYQKRIDAIFDWCAQDVDQPPSTLLKAALEALSDQGLRKKKSLKAKEELVAHPALVALDPITQMLEERQDAREALALAFVGEFIHELRGRIKDMDQAAKVCTFDELLVRVRELLRDPQVGAQVIENTRSTYAAALIDEFQDTDPAQYEIVSSFWGKEHGALFLVGDPKQAIYRFRGADIHAYLRAREDASDGRFILTHNYRSSMGVIGAVNALFSKVQAPFGLKGLDFVPVHVGRQVDRLHIEGGTEASLVFWRGEKRRGAAHPFEIDALAQRVLTLLTKGHWVQEDRPVGTQDMAVLCNSNQQARQIRARFEELKIPCVLRSGQNVWHSPQGQEMSILLRAIAQPGQRQRIKAAMVTQALGLDLGEVWSLSQDDMAWETWTGRFLAWRKLWLERGVLAMWRNLRDKLELGPALAQQNGGLRALTNWEHLADLVYFLEREHRCGPARLCALVDRARANQGAPAEIEELRACDERPSVQILTIHKSKGLEFPIVFCPYLWKAKAKEQPLAFVHRQEGRRVLMLNGPEAQEALERYRHDAHGEARRLLYVALTRAKSHCEVFWIPAKDNASALGTLLAEHDPQHKDPIAGMQALAGAHKDWIDARELDLDAALTSLGPRSSSLDLRGRRPQDPQAWQRYFGPRVTSYSALARGLGADKQVDSNRPGQDESLADPELLQEQAKDPLRFASLVPGAQSGVLLHDLLQLALEPSVLPSERTKALEDAALRLGVADQGLVQEVMEVLNMPLAIDGQVLRLADLSRAQRGVEIEFLFRCGAFGGSNAIGGVDAPKAFELGRLTQILVEHSKDSRLLDYARSLELRGRARVQGFLNGFIDLVFEHQGRYFVADYKSNILDAAQENFEPTQLWAYAVEKDYILQALIYGVALFRRLQQHAAFFDPVEHLGHGYLLFVRGLSEEGHGVLKVPFEPAVIQALSRSMQDGFGALPPTEGRCA